MSLSVGDDYSKMKFQAIEAYTGVNVKLHEFSISAQKTVQ
jgi:hypothetical protein